MTQIVDNFLPIGDFQHFAHSAMTAPYYVPCDFSTKESEADGSIDCFGEDGPPETKFNELMFQMTILRRLTKQNRCVVSDFYFEHFQAIDCIRELLNVKRFYNIRVGCTPVQTTRYIEDYHVDQFNYGTEHCKTALLYLNTNNGGTAFKDGNTFVQSKANRLVKFPVDAAHAVVCTTDTKLRYVLNINYDELDSERINYE
tara:strand:+ start:859 stop:1458 length:600 start_codon:yes stop_codon:yes gene_type:complete